jgi:hypothetical protein
MVDLREYFSESNAIKDVHSESTVEATLEAWEYLENKDSLSHTSLQTAHEYIIASCPFS